MRRRPPLALPLVSVALMVVSGYLFFLTLAEPWPVSTSGSIWDAFAAIGTVAATGVAVLLAWRAARQDKGAVARVVSAWVTDEYFPDDRMTSYQRRVTLHVANESNEPVYEARLNVFAGRDRRPLGPLAAPSVISVVPPRRKLDYDITLPLASHVGTEDPRAELHFTDPAGHRWRRDVLGALEVVQEGSHWAPMSTAPNPEASGASNPGNPLGVVLAFVAGLGASPLDSPEPTPILITLSDASPLRRGDANWEEVRRTVQEYLPTSMVEFPGAQVARAKLVPAALEGQEVVGGSGLEVNDVKWVTLIFANGWRIYDVGPYLRPDQINFNGALQG